MHVLEFQNYQVTPTQEALLIKPIRDIYNKDKSKNKEKFMQILSVIYFYTDPRSSYNYILNDEERLQEIIKQEGLPSDFKITPQIQEAIDIYKQHTLTTSLLLLQDMKVAIDKVRNFLRNVDLTATDDKGKPLYTISTITTAIKQIPQLSKDIMEAEKTVAKEIEEQGRVRGGVTNNSLFEDGI